MTDQQKTEFRQWCKTGICKGTKTENIFTVIRLIGVSMAEARTIELIGKTKKNRSFN
jgi:hypothetical protein